MKITSLIFKYISNEHAKEDNIKEFIDTVPEGSVFYDLGANLGWFSIYAAARGLNTYCFEIDIFNFKGLEENINLNTNLEGKIRTFNKGVAGFNGKGKMLYTNEEIGEHNKILFLEKFSGPHKKEDFPFQREVEVVCLDNFIKEMELPWPDYLKIDIDGSEYSFLEGNPETLKNAKGMVIELFTGNDLFGSCVEILEKAGFVFIKRYEIPGWENGFNYVFSK
jgi:FkbM family methyltransferase